PANQLSRNQSVFFTTSSDPKEVELISGTSAYIYEVDPIGPIYRNDAFWIDYMLGNGVYPYMEGETSLLPQLQMIAEEYWQGKKSENPKWEFRARSVSILDHV